MSMYLLQIFASQSDSMTSGIVIKQKSFLGSEIHVFSADVHVLFRPTAFSNGQHPRECSEWRHSVFQTNLVNDGVERVFNFFLLVLLQISCASHNSGLSGGMSLQTVFEIFARLQTILRLHFWEI